MSLITRKIPNSRPEGRESRTIPEPRYSVDFMPGALIVITVTDEYGVQQASELFRGKCRNVSCIHTRTVQ